MKEELLIPEALRGAFKDFSLLKSDQEKALFWVELAKTFEETPPETINQLLTDGLLSLSDAVDELGHKVLKVSC